MDSDPSQTTKPPQKPLELPRDFALSEAEQYAKKVAAGEIKPSKEDLRGFLPQKGIGGGRMTGATRASDAKLDATNKATKEANKDKLTLSALVPREPKETALIENRGYEAAAKQQGDDLAMASAALVATINTDSMFFRGMKLHQKILAGERPFEIEKESGLLTEKGKMDVADYEHFYEHPNRQITMLHGAAEVLSMVGSEVGHTFQHLAGDATPVLNPYYKDKPNWPELQEEAKAFVMQGVTLKIGVDELKSGKANKDNAISVAEMSGREVREVHAERSRYIELYKRYVNPPEVKGKDGKVFRAQPLFVDPSFWESTGNKTMGSIEAGTRVLKGWYNLAADSSKDPLSWHGAADDKLRHLALEHEYQFVKDDPSKQDKARKLLAQIKDSKSIRATRINTAADDIASMNKWASGEYMVWAPHKGNSFEVDPAAGPGIRPDPNIWTPGQTWMDPMVIYGLGSGAFRAMRAASAAEASMLSRYAAIAKLASVESFALDVATIAKGLAGMDDFMKATGLEAAADAGMDAAKLSQEQLIEMGLRRILENPMALDPAKFTTKLVDDVLNSFPKPAAVAMTEEEWQLLSGTDKLRNLDPPASFAGVPEGAEVWKKMNDGQRMQVIMGEKTSEVYKLARQRQVAAIASAQADTARTAAETAETNSNAGVVRRTAGKFTSIFGEYVMGGRELGRGFWRDLSVAGLLNGSADIVENALRGGVSATLGKDAGLKVEEFLRDQSQARYVFRAQVALGSALGINIADSVFGENQTWLKYPKYMINTLGFVAGARVLGYNSQSIGKFMKVWGDEIARGDPTLWRGYAAKIAKNPEAYGFDPAEVMGPKGIANFVANFGVEAGLRFGKRALYDFGVKGGGVAELMVYGKDRDSKGQGLAIGTAFSAVGYYMALGVNKGLGRTRINAMRSDAMNRIGMTMEGDPTNLMMFIKAHETSLKGGFEEDFLGFVLGVDNSTKAKLRFVDGKSANMLRFAYDYGMVNQAESIRKMVALGFRTPEDIIGAKLKQEEFGKIATELRNKMTEESRVLTLDFEAQRDVARQLTDKLKDPRLTTEEKMDIGTQKMMVQARIKQIQIRNGEIAQSLKIGDNLTFIRANGIDPATVNARVRAGVNEVTGNPLITFKGLTIESTKDGPIVYMNVDRLTTKAMWHEAAEAVLLAGGIETVVKDATLKLFGNMGKNPGTMQENKRVVDEALKAGKAVDTYEFFTTELVHQATKDGVLNPALIADMIRAHAKSANLDGAWEANAFSAVREYLTTGDQTAISSLTREIFANYVGLHLEQTTTLAGTPNKLALFENGSWGMTLYGFSERILNSMKGDAALAMEGHSQLSANASAAPGTQTGIRSFFTDPATGKRITITALERLSREAIKRSGKGGLDAEGRALVDLRKLKPEERRAWVTANNVSHWVDESGNLRDPKEIVRIEAGMMNQSIMELERIRSENPNIVRGVKKVEKNKNGETHTITGNLSAPEIMVMLNNPDVPENIKKTLLAYSKAVFRSDNQIGLIQGMYSGESKETVYTPQSTPSLREWGSPLLAPEHRALLPLSLTVAWETDNAGAIVAARVNVNGLDWKKGIEPRVRIAAGSDLAKANNLTMSELYGYMQDYITNLNKGTNNKLGTDNAIPSAELFDPTGNNPTRGENIRDLMHFIFDFQKKKGDAYINQPGDWGELGLRGPTHPYTTFSAHRWTGAEADADGRFIRVNDTAYKLSQGNFMGAAEDNVPPRKLNRADVGEQSPDKEAEAVRRAEGPETTIDPPIEKGKVVDPTSSIELNPAIALEQISDVYSLNGEAIPKVVSNWIKAYERDLINRPPKTTEEYVRRLHDIAYEKSRQSVGLNISKAEKERAQYAEPVLSKLYFKVKELADAKRAQIDAEKRGIVQANAEATAAEATAIDAAKDVNTNAARQGDAAKNVPTPISNAARKDLEMANDQISMWREIVDQGLKDEAGGVEVSLSAAELPYNQKQLRKYLDLAYSIKENFDPGFDVATYFPDYKKPDLRQDVQAAINAEAAAVRQVEVANTPTGQANMPLVTQFKDKATDALTRLAVMRLPGSKDIPEIISTLTTGSNSIAKNVTSLLNVLEGGKGTVDYVYAADAAAGYSKSIDLMIQAQNKAEAAALKAGNKDKAKLAVDVRTQLEVLKNTVDGIQEYAQDLADTAPARQVANAGIDLNDPKVVEWRKENGVTNNKDGDWIEQPSKEVMKLIDEPFVRLAQTIESAKIDGYGPEAYKEQANAARAALKKAMDKGLTAKEFYALYDMGKGSNRTALLKEIEPIIGKAFPKEGLSNVLVPVEDTIKNFGGSKPKPKKPVAAEAEPAVTSSGSSIPMGRGGDNSVQPQYAGLDVMGTSVSNGRTIYKLKDPETGKVSYVGEEEYWLPKNSGSATKPVVAEPAAAAETKPTAKPKGAADDGVVLGDDQNKWPKNYQRTLEIIDSWFDTERILSTDPQYRSGDKPKWQKGDAMKAAQDTIAQLKKEGITPEMARKIFLGYDQWNGSAAKWAMPAMKTLYAWITSDLQGGKPKPKAPAAAAVDIPPQLEASTEPTTTGKPTLSDKEVKTRLRELEGKLEEMYELDDIGEDSSDTQVEAQEVITALRNAGVGKDVIQDILDNSAVGGDYGWTLNPSTPKGGSGSGAKPPKPPKPTANAAGADDVPDLPKPKTPKVPDHVVPDAPLIRDPDLEWVVPNDPKKNPNDIKRNYGTKVRKRIDDDLAAVLDDAEAKVKAVMDMVRKKGVGFDSKAVIQAYNSLESVLAEIENNANTTVTDYGIDMFDLSPKVRERFGQLFELETSEWWSKSQKTRQKNVLKETKDYKERLMKVAADRVLSDMLGELSTQTIEKTGDPKKGNYQSVMNILSKKMPWIMADDRTLLPLTTAIDNFIVTERVVDPDAKTGTGGTSGLIFIDKTAKTSFGEPAMYNIMNNIMGTHFWGYRNNGFMDLQVLNVNGDRRTFRISTQGTRGISAKELQKLYAEAVKEQQDSKEPGSPMPALQFDKNGTSFGANKEGLLLMNAEIEGFLRQGQVKKNEGDRKAGARQQQDLKKQQREAEAKAKADAEVLAAAEKTKQAQLRIGLYGRQPIDPNNPNTAMAVVEGHKTVVSRRADSLVEVHKSKDKEGYTFYRVEYLGDDFGGPRQILRTVSQDIAMNLAQSFTPFGGWRDAVLNIVDGLSVPESGPWPGKDGNPTNDPKMVKSLADMVKTRDAEFADAVTRIRASGTYGVIDMGQGEVLVVPKKSFRDKNGNLDMSQAVKLSRRLIFQVQNFAQQGESAQAARQAANARPPAPRIDPATGRPLAPGSKPAPAQAPAPAQGQAPLPVQEFTNDRVNGILQTARNTQNIAKAEAVSTVVKILTNRDNFKIMYMKNGTIRVYGVNNNLLAVTDDEETAFSWLTK